MIETIRQSLGDVFTQQFGIELAPCKSKPRQEGYQAVIPFESDGKRWEAHVWLPQKALDQLALALFGDETPDEATREDLVREIANLVIGHFKSLSEAKGRNYTIGTPDFMGVGKVAKGDETLLYKLGNRCIAVTIKALDG
jgi:chemotaxis protein CheY-P-specific phosphatase CheC